MKQVITFLFFLFLSIHDLKACSCECVFYCDYAERMETGLIIYGEVVEKVSYSDDNQAIYLNVLHKFKGGDITDLIKIYGVDSSVTCSESIDSYNIGDQYIFSFDDSLLHWNAPIINPDANIEDYVSYRPFTCGRHRLRVINGMVRGKIWSDQTVSEYPLDLFIEEADDCSFAVTNVDAELNVEENFIIYPNPISDLITIKNSTLAEENVTLKIYASDGKLIQIKENFPINEQVSNWPSLKSGVYYLEILWKNKRIIKKIISREK